MDAWTSASSQYKISPQAACNPDLYIGFIAGFCAAHNESHTCKPIYKQLPTDQRSLSAMSYAVPAPETPDPAHNQANRYTT